MIKVFGARCVVKELKNEAATESGIILPGREKESTNQGIVISVGNGAILDNGTKVPMDVKPGDKVVYASFAGSPIVTKDNQEDQEYLILNERDILAKIED